MSVRGSKSMSFWTRNRIEVHAKLGRQTCQVYEETQQTKQHFEVGAWAGYERKRLNSGSVEWIKIMFHFYSFWVLVWDHLLV